MKKTIILTRVSSKYSNLNSKIDNLVTYCCNNNLSIIKEYPIYAKHNDTHYIKNLYQEIKAIPNKHINIVAYSIEDFLPNIETLELFANLVKKGKVSLHFCKENLIYDSQTPASEIYRLDILILAYQYRNIHNIPKDKLQYVADKIYITQMQENIKANLLKNQ